MALLIAALVLGTAAPPAHAVDPQAVITAAKTAYDAYQKFSGGQMTLEQATTLIITAINTAKVEIIAHIDLLAAADVKACATRTVITGLDLPRMSPDSVQAFADTALDCVTKAQGLIDSADTLGAVDLAGFALNVVGPVALFAREYAHLTAGIPALKATLVAANTNLTTRLQPSCFSSQLPDNEWMLHCRAYNGNEGFGFAFGGNPFNWNRPIAQAMRGTSYLVALAVLPRLQV
jgi:hypothetical protein